MAVISTLPTVTPPWVADKKAQASQQPSHQLQHRPQQIQQPKQSLNYLDTANKLYKTYNKLAGPKPYWGGGASAASGAATGSIAASGGTYVSGAGLAGEASAINTTAGAAGAAASSYSGLETGGVGLAAGLIGQKLFGGEGGAGASLGSVVAMGASFGPVGIVVGGLLGGALGGLFGDKHPDDIWFTTFSGDKPTGTFGASSSKFNRKHGGEALASSTGSLGKFSVSKWEDLPGNGVSFSQKFTKQVTQIDDAVALGLTQQQVQQATQALDGTTKWSGSWREGKSNQASSSVTSIVKNRYEITFDAIGRNDISKYFNTYADNSNVAVVATGLAHVANVMKEGEPVGDAIDHIAARYGIEKPKSGQTSDYVSTTLKTYLEKEQVANSIATPTIGRATNIEQNQPGNQSPNWQGGINAVRSQSINNTSTNAGLLQRAGYTT